MGLCAAGLIKEEQLRFASGSSTEHSDCATRQIVRDANWSSSSQAKSAAAGYFGSKSTSSSSARYLDVTVVLKS